MYKKMLKIKNIKINLFFVIFFKLLNNKNKVIIEIIQEAMEYCTVHNSTDDATFAAQKKNQGTSHSICLYFISWFYLCRNAPSDILSLYYPLQDSHNVSLIESHVLPVEGKVGHDDP
jgi:hypothetical protein